MCISICLLHLVCTLLFYCHIFLAMLLQKLPFWAEGSIGNNFYLTEVEVEVRFEYILPSQTPLVGLHRSGYTLPSPNLTCGITQVRVDSNLPGLPKPHWVCCCISSTLCPYCIEAISFFKGLYYHICVCACALEIITKGIQPSHRS